MGRLIDGVWHDDVKVIQGDNGKFVRKESVFLTGLQQMARRDLRPSLGVIIYTFAWPVRGRIVR